MRELTEPEMQHHADEVAKQGFSIMENAIDEEFRTALLKEFEHLEQVRPGGDLPPAPFSGYVTRRWFDVLNDGDIWQRVATHPWILGVLPEILGENFLLSTMGTAIIGPGEDAQPLHVDDGVYAFPRPHPNLVCNTMWAISDFTVESGATMVVPESNHWDHDPVFNEDYDAIPLQMPAGSIAFVLGACYHGAGKNATDQDRVALTINYCNGSMRQQENLMLGVHPERMMTFSPELQDILGFKICKGAGHLFASDPRSEMARHYGPGNPNDPYLERRSALHVERIKRKTPPAN